MRGRRIRGRALARAATELGVALWLARGPQPKLSPTGARTVRERERGDRTIATTRAIPLLKGGMDQGQSRADVNYVDKLIPFNVLIDY